MNAIATRTNKNQKRKLFIFNHFSQKLSSEKNFQFEDTPGYERCKLVYYDIYDIEVISKSF